MKKPKFWDYNKISIEAIFLLPLAVTYQFVFWLIKTLKPKKKFPIPIVCVGNIYIGGTGKTPLAKEIFKIAVSLNKNPAFVKKPYAYLSDEIKMLEKTGKIYKSNTRVKSISLLINNNYNIAILDDGFQDFSIKPDLSILCFNSNQLLGNGFTIPAGPLRENFSSIKRADCIMINGNKNFEFENKIKELKKDIKIFYSNYKIKNLEKLKNKKVFAFAGIGNPQNFFTLLKENNINVEKTYSFPDHHNFSDSDYYKITKNNYSMQILTTEKDYHRLNDEIKKIVNIVEVDLEIEKKNEFIDLVKSKL